MSVCVTRRSVRPTVYYILVKSSFLLNFYKKKTKNKWDRTQTSQSAQSQKSLTDRGVNKQDIIII